MHTNLEVIFAQFMTLREKNILARGVEFKKKEEQNSGVSFNLENYAVQHIVMHLKAFKNYFCLVLSI